MDRSQSADDRRREFEEKHRRITAWLNQANVDGVLFRRRDNFAWITGGGEHRVAGDTELGVAGLWVDRNGMVLLSPNNEVARLDEEELHGLKLEIVAWPWYKDAGAEMERFIAGRSAASDTAFAGLPDRSDSLAPLRFSLTEQEIERYRALGRDAAKAVEAVAQESRRGEKEYALAARLNERLLDLGIEPTVTLVAADDRIERYRHPIPTDAEVGYRVMLVSCARRFGLTAALTRIVHLGDLSRELESRHQAVSEVDAGVIAATRPGTTGNDLFTRLCDLYSEAGYPGEWELHHQGGAIGYCNRDWLALPDQSLTVQPYQAFAWNPSITGTKSEDTILVTEDGFETLTIGDGKWPQRTVDVDGRTVMRPDILTV